jgi:hypothetical protein
MVENVIKNLNAIILKILSLTWMHCLVMDVYFSVTKQILQHPLSW